MPSIKLARFYSFAAQHPCAAGHCHEPVELHHITGGVSLKNGLQLARRQKHAEALVVPLCARHHRTGTDSVHMMGEAGFERFHNQPEGHLLGLAASLLAAYVMGAK
jgi:hypothetical protein